MPSHRGVGSPSEAYGSYAALDRLRSQLEALDQQTSVEVLLQLSISGPQLHERIETMAQTKNRGSAAMTLLVRRLDRLIDIDDYHTYYEAREYSRGLEQWLDDVAFTLLPDEPASARDLLERFLRADQQIIESVDDSDGNVGQVFRRACELWHRAAGLEPAGGDWVARLLSLYGTNGYGLRDALLDHAGPHLPDPNLRRLAGIFEERARRASGKTESYERSAAIAALGQVARTLRDAHLYERAIRMHPGEPNSLQALQIARRYLEFGPVESALEWLERHREEGRFDHERRELLAEAYQRLGDRRRLIAVRREIAERSLSIEALDALIAVLPEAEHAATRQAAIERARRALDPVAGGRLLLHLGEGPAAAGLIIGEMAALKGCFYGGILELACDLQKAGESLAEVACYRVLVLQILEAGRSKAYHHAADYLLHLDALDRAVSDHASLVDHATFARELRTAHRRKRSFWKLVDDR